MAKGPDVLWPGRVIVTRPEQDALSWAKDLQSHGVPCEILPLIDIAPLSDTSELTRAWQVVHQHRAVMFVSANAVRFFMAARPIGMDVGTCRAWSTGPGTHAALLDLGWPVHQIDSPDPCVAQFDSEALWQQVSPQLMDRRDGFHAPVVLIVRGADGQGRMAGRDWLAQQLEQAGARVLQHVAYLRRPPIWTPEQQVQARQSLNAGRWWLFSSSEAAQHLHDLCPDLPWSTARALATHPRIAERLKKWGWGRVETVPAGVSAQAESIKLLP